MSGRSVKIHYDALRAVWSEYRTWACRTWFRVIARFRRSGARNETIGDTRSAGYDNKLSFALPSA